MTRCYRTEWVKVYLAVDRHFVKECGTVTDIASAGHLTCGVRVLLNILSAQ